MTEQDRSFVQGFALGVLLVAVVVYVTGALFLISETRKDVSAARQQRKEMLTEVSAEMALIGTAYDRASFKDCQTVWYRDELKAKDEIDPVTGASVWTAHHDCKVDGETVRVDTRARHSVWFKDRAEEARIKAATTPTPVLTPRQPE